jgi:hypothetical protein
VRALKRARARPQEPMSCYESQQFSQQEPRATGLAHMTHSHPITVVIVKRRRLLASVVVGFGIGAGISVLLLVAVIIWASIN